MGPVISYYIKRLILVSVIQLSVGHCIFFFFYILVSSFNKNIRPINDVKRHTSKINSSFLSSRRIVRCCKKIGSQHFLFFDFLFRLRNSFVKLYCCSSPSSGFQSSLLNFFLIKRFKQSHWWWWWSNNLLKGFF